MIKDKIRNKIAAFIPVLSMRDYQTGKYKLNCDGNMMRVLSMIYESGVKHAYITIPKLQKIDEHDFGELKKRIESKFGTLSLISFVYSDSYGSNAKETRDCRFIHYEISKLLAAAEVVIIEPQGMILNLLDFKNNDVNEKLIYWCVASCTENYTPWFVKDYELIDKRIAEEIPTACATKTQVEFLKGKAYHEEFYNPKFSDMKIIFFPFRLSDPSYQAEKFRDMIIKLNQKANNSFKVLYSDPNISGIFDGMEEYDILKVPSDFALYISILKGAPIIPYFENADEVKHISIEEMAMYKCQIVCYDNDEIQRCENVHMIKKDDDYAFFNKLLELVES